MWCCSCVEYSSLTTSHSWRGLAKGKTQNESKMTRESNAVLKLCFIEINRLPSCIYENIIIEKMNSPLESKESILDFRFRPRPLPLPSERTGMTSECAQRTCCRRSSWLAKFRSHDKQATFFGGLSFSLSGGISVTSTEKGKKAITSNDDFNQY